MKLRSVAPLLLVLAGLAVLLYPVVATQHNNAEQQRIAAAYQASVSTMGPDTVAEEIELAQDYNQALTVLPILDPWIESQRPDTAEYQTYLGQLDIDPVMGRISIPKIHVNLPIYHGTDPDTLEHGVGHLFGTSLPVGGDSTHAVLTGHTGLGSATLFDDLTKVDVGDSFYVNVLDRTLKYTVTSISIVEPSDTSSLVKVPSRDLVTLITCTPYGVNSHRLLVTGERTAIDPTQAAIEEADALPAPMATWMIVVLVCVAVISLMVVAAVIHHFATRRKNRQVPGHAKSGTIVR